MQPSFRSAFPPPLLRSEFSVELAPLPPSTGSFSLRRSFCSDAAIYEALIVDPSLVRDEEVSAAMASIPKKSPLQTASEKTTLAPALKRRSSRNYAQAPVVHFIIPKPDGEQGRVASHGPSGKKGYLLKAVCTNADSPHTLKWTNEDFTKAQTFIDTLIVEYLDVEVSRTSQKPKSLENLRTKVLETYPIIGQGERDWVFSNFVAAGLKREKQKKRKKETATAK